MKDKFIKRLVIIYIITYLYGFIIAIIPNFNPYIFVSVIYTFLIWIFYISMTINLTLTFVYIIGYLRNNEVNKNGK